MTGGRPGITLHSIQVHILRQQLSVGRVKGLVGLAQPLDHRCQFIQTGLDRLRPDLLVGSSLLQMTVDGLKVFHRIIVQRSRHFPPSFHSMAVL
jgi:hypothetical protein